METWNLHFRSYRSLVELRALLGFAGCIGLPFGNGRSLAALVVRADVFRSIISVRC